MIWTGTATSDRWFESAGELKNAGIYFSPARGPGRLLRADDGVAIPSPDMVTKYAGHTLIHIFTELYMYKAI